MSYDPPIEQHAKKHEVIHTTRTLLQVQADGTPRPVAMEYIMPVNLNSARRAALARPYVLMRDENGCIREGEERFLGMSNVEVAEERHAERMAQGDLESYKYGMDRDLGKATQRVESQQITGTLTDFIDLIIAKERADPQQPIVDVEPVAIKKNAKGL